MYRPVATEGADIALTRCFQYNWPYDYGERQSFHYGEQQMLRDSFSDSLIQEIKDLEYNIHR